MSHTDDVLAEIVAANEKVCEARSAMNVTKAVASAKSKAYAEAVDNLTLTIPGQHSATPLFDQAETDHAAAEAEVPPAGVCRVCGCTEENPCPGGCAWADKTRTLCTRCANSKPKPGQTEPEYFPPFKDGEPAIRSEAQADQEIYDQVKPRPRGRKTGRKPTKKRSKTRRN